MDDSSVEGTKIFLHVWLRCTITDVYKYLRRESRGRISDLADSPGDVRAFHRERTPSAESENGRVATSVPLITDNSRKVRGCERNGRAMMSGQAAGAGERERNNGKGAGRGRVVSGWCWKRNRGAGRWFRWAPS